MKKLHKNPENNRHYIENAIWHIRQIDSFDNNYALINLTIRLFSIIHAIDGRDHDENKIETKVVYEITPELEAQLQAFMYSQKTNSTTDSEASSDGGKANARFRPKVN